MLLSPLCRKSLRHLKPRSVYKRHASKTSPALQLEEILALNPTLHKNATLKPTKITDRDIQHWRRATPARGCTKAGDFSEIEGPSKNLSEADALFEAHRCLKCADAPCQNSCPTQIDVKQFISQINSKNFYGAAQTIFSDNPLGLTCGMVCPASRLCEGSCNLHASGLGSIDITGLQEFTTQVLQKMNMRQIRDPSLQDVSELPSSYQSKIACIGGGPASISCATFLARLGYSDVTVFEKDEFLGGLSMTEIPEFRLPSKVVNFEVALMTDLGVKVQTGKALGSDGFTLDSLKKEGYEAVFVAIGNPKPKTDPVFSGLTKQQGYFTSKDFLPQVSAGSKPGLASFIKESVAPRLSGRVIVFGAGDTAMDCASSAFRCGAERVTLALRRGLPELRAAPEEWEPVQHEHTELLPYCLPKQVILNDDGSIKALVMHKTEQKDGEVVIDEDQTITVKCDYIISAFGSTFETEEERALSPLELRHRGGIAVSDGMQSQIPWIFSGGDVVGSGTTVQATNDGKTASWNMHKFIQGQHGNNITAVPNLPKFYTPVDNVDISVDFAGLKFKNPFGLASAPPTTSIPMMKRAYEQGWGFAVTKTFVLDKDEITNISPRITRGGTATAGSPGPNQSSFINIELISEKYASYWCKGIRELVEEYPDHITIASLMCGNNKEDWQELVQMTQEAGAHAMEMNLSCPHGMGEKGMGLACGQLPELVTDISKWIAEVATIPFFIKLTPNVTEIVDIAKAARDGGATGVTAINTVSGLVPVTTHRPLGMSVGETPDVMKTTFGGLAGNAVKPMALRAVANIAHHLPGFPVMAAGGVDSADASLEFIENGAGVTQVCSAVMNQDFTVVQDYISGLKARLYMMDHSSYKDWNGQSPPYSSLSVSEVPEAQNQHLPDFGPYREQRHQIRSKAALNGAYIPNGGSTKGSDDEAPTPMHMRTSDPVEPSHIPTVNDLIARDVKRNTSTHNDLARNEQVYAKVHEDLCLNCGKCYMACNDSGYQAILFDEQTHLPNILEDKCTGCGLCISVCPASNVGCIVLENRTDKSWQVNRA